MILTLVLPSCYFQLLLTMVSMHTICCLFSWWGSAEVGWAAFLSGAKQLMKGEAWWQGG